MEMFRSVLILGTVTTSHMTAREALTQAHPYVADLDAILTHRNVLRMDIADLVAVSAIFCWFGHTTIISRDAYFSSSHPEIYPLYFLLMAGGIVRYAPIVFRQSDDPHVHFIRHV